jgi:hypothetical protein
MPQSIEKTAGELHLDERGTVAVARLRADFCLAPDAPFEALIAAINSRL